MSYSRAKRKSAAVSANVRLQTHQIRATKTVRRRPGFQQGRALEIIGHAIEYLIDSPKIDPQSEINFSAIDILAKASRAVFEECPEVVSLGDRIRKRLATYRLLSAGQQ
jgi:hypothetical protein